MIAVDAIAFHSIAAFPAGCARADAESPPTATATRAVAVSRAIRACWIIFTTIARFMRPLPSTVPRRLCCVPSFLGPLRAVASDLVSRWGEARSRLTARRLRHGGTSSVHRSAYARSTCTPRPRWLADEQTEL